MNPKTIAEIERLRRELRHPQPPPITIQTEEKRPMTLVRRRTSTNYGRARCYVLSVHGAKPFVV